MSIHKAEDIIRGQLWLQSYAPHKVWMIIASYKDFGGWHKIKVYCQNNHTHFDASVEDFDSMLLIQEAPKPMDKTSPRKNELLYKALRNDGPDGPVYSDSYGAVYHLDYETVEKMGISQVSWEWIQEFGIPLEQEYGDQLDVPEHLRKFLPKTHKFFPKNPDDIVPEKTYISSKDFVEKYFTNKVRNAIEGDCSLENLNKFIGILNLIPWSFYRYFRGNTALYKRDTDQLNEANLRYMEEQSKIIGLRDNTFAKVKAIYHQFFTYHSFDTSRGNGILYIFKVSDGDDTKYYRRNSKHIINWKNQAPRLEEVSLRVNLVELFEPKLR